MGVVEIVRRADGDVVDTVFGGTPAKLFQVSVVAFDFGEVSDVGGVSVEDANDIVWSDSGNQSACGRLDRLKMAQGDEASDSSNGEIRWAVIRPASRQRVNSGVNGASLSRTDVSMRALRLDDGR